MDTTKKIAIISFAIVSLLLFSVSFIHFSNQFFPRQEAPTIEEGLIIARNWIKNFSTYYMNGKDLQLITQEELDLGKYKFTFSFTADDEHFGVQENTIVIETRNTEITSAIKNDIFNEKTGEYLEELETKSLYFIDQNNNITSIQREVSVSTIEDKRRVVLEELLNGPTQEEKNDGFYTSIKENTRILHFQITNNVLFIELDFDFMSSDLAREQIKKTMQQFDDITEVKEPEREEFTTLKIEGIPDDFIFEDNLEKGDEGIDVKYLQIILNADLDTLITDVGAGSPGEESEKFDENTKNAVKKFQRKYAQEILVPAGLILSTGTVDEYTRDKLNAILEESRW